MIQLRNLRVNASQCRRATTLLCAVALAALWAGCTGPRDSASGAAPVAWHFKVQGMHCNGCAGGIRSELVAVPGVLSAKVRYPEADAEVKVDPAQVDQEKLIKVIQEAGYQATRIP